MSYINTKCNKIWFKRRNPGAWRLFRVRKFFIMYALYQGSVAGSVQMAAAYFRIYSGRRESYRDFFIIILYGMVARNFIL